jgi:hypothetical protein
MRDVRAEPAPELSECGGVTGGGMAVPIFKSVIEAVWQNSSRTVLAPPSPEAKRQLACQSTGREPAEENQKGRNALTECFRLNGKGKIVDTQYRLVSHEREENFAERFSRKKSEKDQTIVGRGVDWSHDPWQVPQNATQNSWDYGSVRF